MRLPLEQITKVKFSCNVLDINLLTSIKMERKEVNRTISVLIAKDNVSTVIKPEKVIRTN